MRLLTAGSLVRVQQGEPKEPDRSNDLSGSFTFPCYPRTNFPELNSRAAVRRRAAAITRNFFAATGNFQARVQCFLKLPCFLPQKQGVSGAVATETTMFQGEGSLAMRVASRFAKPRGFPVRKMSTRRVLSRQGQTFCEAESFKRI